MVDFNLQPILDLLAKAGDETTEFKKARAAGRAAIVVWVVGLLIFIASTVAAVMGANSKIGIASGAFAGALGIIAQAMVSMGYSAARGDTKAAAASIVAAAAVPTAPASGPAA